MSSAVDQARAVGDAVLYEGYLLYPYRASAAKNRMRWQFGVLMPPAFASPEHGEFADSRTECLLEPRSDTVLHLRLRFLQAQRRTVQIREGDGGYRDVAATTVGKTEYTSWDEAVEQEVDTAVPVADLSEVSREIAFTVPGSDGVEEVAAGTRLRRRSLPLAGLLSARAEPLPGPYGGLRLRVDVRNTTAWADQVPSREAALHRALLAAHLVLWVDTGRFLSLLDPPEWARPAAQACRNERTWPVLIGEPGQDQAGRDQPGQDQVVLSSPIILYDYPSIAPESQGELFDGTEIDEILTLRTIALTDEEKRQARATDPRARELIDRVDSMPPELMERLHGTIRYLRAVTGEVTDPAGEGPGPADADVVVAGVRVAAGSRVRLHPGLRRADAQDMFLDGRIATVRAVLTDADGDTHLAVTVDDDPAADLQTAHGRFRYFAPDEVEPLATAARSQAP